MKIDLSRFRQAFFQEAAEHVDNMESALLTLDPNSADSESLSAIFRAAHSIKGASGTFALDEVTQFTHVLEELLDRMRQGSTEASPERVNLLLRACDMLRAILVSAEGGAPAPDGMRDMLRSLTLAQRAGDFELGAGQTLRKTDAPVQAGAQRYRITFRPASSVFQEGMDPLLVVRELSYLGTFDSVAADVADVPDLSEMKADVCYLAWQVELTTEKPSEEIRDVFAFVEDGAELNIQQIDAAPKNDGAKEKKSATSATSGASRHDSGSIRVATNKVDDLINLVGELLIAHSMAVDVADHFAPERLRELQAALAEVGRNTQMLQEGVMGIRMLPVGTAFARLPRIVHDIADANEKSIRLEIEGEETELDKSILEGMIDPLTHLVRNAADHGIETVPERVSAGKPQEGVISIRARHEGGNFVIQVTDDGRGLSVERIRRKALERGLMSETDELTDDQIRAFVFHAGFSTAESVTEISGRGVGMDVVRKNVEALGGGVSLTSREGEGTTVSVRLPLTLAILDGQLVRVGSETYVLPLLSIVESVKPTSSQVRSIAGEGEVVVVRQESIPLLRLHQLFGVTTDVIDPARGLVAIVENDGRRLALLVDELLGQQQVVIKNLQTNFRKVDGAMGATILGDGRVSLILDVAGLAELSNRKDLPALARAAC